MFKSKYADLESIISAVRPILNANGLFMRQIVGNGENCVTVETIISHVEGAELSSGILSIPVNFGKGVGAQAVGSAITYAKRYSLCSFLGIAADEDDDGNSANLERPNTYTPPARQAPRPAPKPAADHSPSPADIADDADIGLREEVAEYTARIVESENMNDLNAIAEELKVCNFPESATKAIRTVWANKRKEFVK
jgi:hypothetical protein